MSLTYCRFSYYNEARVRYRLIICSDNTAQCYTTVVLTCMREGYCTLYEAVKVVENMVIAIHL